MSKPKQLQALFIDELGQELSIEELNKISGGGKEATTMAVGEEYDEPPTTMAVGEEGVTSMSLGEES